MLVRDWSVELVVGIVAMAHITSTLSQTARADSKQCHNHHDVQPVEIAVDGTKASYTAGGAQRWCPPTMCSVFSLVAPRPSFPKIHRDVVASSPSLKA